MICTAHQSNFLPGASILTKLEASDQVIWLDEVQYTKGGWTNRQMMPDGSWLTVPIERRTDGFAINRVRIAEHDDWRTVANKTLMQHYGRHSWIDEVLDVLNRPYRLLCGLNLALLRVVLDELRIETEWVFQSHLDGGRAVIAVSDQAEHLLPISERLAMMVEEVGGSVYLSGPSGRHYLDEWPFEERGIEVRYWQHSGPNPCALSVLAEQINA